MGTLGWIDEWFPSVDGIRAKGVRGEELSITQKNWVTIHGHPVNIGGGHGSGGGGGGGGSSKPGAKSSPAEHQAFVTDTLAAHRRGEVGAGEVDAAAAHASAHTGLPAALHKSNAANKLDHPEMFDTSGPHNPNGVGGAASRVTKPKATPHNPMLSSSASGTGSVNRFQEDTAAHAASKPKLGPDATASDKVAAVMHRESKPRKSDYEPLKPEVWKTPVKHRGPAK